MTGDRSSAAGGPVVGLVGCGRWGRHVLRDLVALGCEVVVAGRSEATARAARDGGAAGIVRSVTDLPAVDGIVVVTPTSTHAAVTADALEAGVPVFVEKPLTDDPDAAAALAAAVPDELFVMDKWRYHPGVRALAEIVRSGELGAATALHLRRVSRGHHYADVDPVWILLPHDLAIALEILGEVPPARWAVPERSGGHRVGLTGTLGDAVPVTVEVSAGGAAHEREVRLVCERGAAVLAGGYAEHVTVLRGLVGTPDVEERPIAGELPLLAELRAFVAHLGGGPGPRSSAAEGAEIVARVAELGELAARAATGAARA